MYTAVYLMCNMFRIYLIKHLTDMFFQGENPDKKHVVGVCIVFLCGKQRVVYLS